MREKIFAIAIFLLTLLPVLDIGDAATLYAQNLAYENGSYWLPDVEVEGNDPSKITCDCCHGAFGDREAFERHLKYSMECALYFGINDDDVDRDDDDSDDYIDGYCVLCRLPIELCTCHGVDVPGSNGGNHGSGGGGLAIGGGGSSSGGYVSGSSSIGANNGRDNTTISMKELILRSNVKLVSRTKLPQKLHPQTKSSECVVRAFCFMAEICGNDYNAAYDILTKIAVDKGYILDDHMQGGIPARDAIKIFDSYCELGYGNYDESEITNLIDGGKAVALTTLEKPPHMVTVIGYDSNFYYTAAGNPNGDVTIYPKNNLMGAGYIYLKNVKTPYK